jgi:hypothetical protein
VHVASHPVSEQRGKGVVAARNRADCHEGIRNVRTSSGPTFGDVGTLCNVIPPQMGYGSGTSATQLRVDALDYFLPAFDSRGAARLKPVREVVIIDPYVIPENVAIAYRCIGTQFDASNNVNAEASSGCLRLGNAADAVMIGN